MRLVDDVLSEFGTRRLGHREVVLGRRARVDLQLVGFAHEPKSRGVAAGIKAVEVHLSAPE